MTAANGADHLPSISPPGLYLMRELFKRAAIMMRFSHVEERELLSIAADDMFQVMHNKFEVYLKSLCTALLPADQQESIGKIGGNKVTRFLDLLEKELGVTLVNEVARRMLKRPRDRRNALTHDAAVSSDIQPGTATKGFSLLDQLPEGQQHFIQAATLIFSTVAHIETTLHALRPGAFLPPEDDEEAQAWALTLEDTGLQHLPEAMDALDLKPRELLRTCSILSTFQQAVPDGWPLPVPPVFEAALMYLRLGLFHVISEGVVELVFTDEFTAALTQSDVIFSVNPEALTRAVFTQEEAFGTSWGVVWYPNFLAAYWPLDELPDVVRAHFQLPSPEEADALA